MSQDTELLTEIRDLLLLIAEPAIEKRDQKRRADLREVVGKSQKKGLAVLLMDGAKPQSAIIKGVGIDQGDLSRLVKALAKKSLIAPDEKHPKLLLRIPSDFFTGNGKIDE